MRSAPFRLRAPDGVELYVSHFAPDPPQPPRAVVQLLHGMGEHCARYERLAAALCADGFAFYAADCRGHGQSAASDAELGHFADRDGWEKAVADVQALGERISATHPGVARVLIGHSMGSFLALDYLTRFGDRLSAAVLSGSAPSAGALGWVFRGVAAAERLRLGARGRSELLRQLLFGRFNTAFEPARTPFDWLSRDEAEVAKYVADPHCGFVLSAGSFADFAAGLSRFQRRSVLARVPHTLPLYTFAGELDPVGGAAGMTRLVEELRAAGLERVDAEIYPGGRHEMLNETNRDEVTRALLAWIRRALAPATSR
ncbi:MAG: alpha/beta fold hydrolase [Myxococcota bacterium]